MRRIPFTVYDFFGYLAAGFLLLASYDYAFDQKLLLHDDLSLVAGLFWTVSAYIVGHIIANFAGFLLQGQLVGRLLGPPEERLFGSNRPGGWRRFFPGYHLPLPKKTQERVLTRAKEKIGWHVLPLLEVLS